MASEYYKRNAYHIHDIDQKGNKLRPTKRAYYFTIDFNKFSDSKQSYQPDYTVYGNDKDAWNAIVNDYKVWMKEKILAWSRDEDPPNLDLWTDDLCPTTRAASWHCRFLLFRGRIYRQKEPADLPAEPNNTRFDWVYQCWDINCGCQILFPPNIRQLLEHSGVERIPSTPYPYSGYRDIAFPKDDRNRSSTIVMHSNAWSPPKQLDEA
jgi:hypothetical protein